jgi:hypothetical protein
VEYFRLLVLKTAALRGLLIKMCGGIVGERTGLVKEMLDERTTLCGAVSRDVKAADCCLASGGV